jgi:hypothetical protein
MLKESGFCNTASALLTLPPQTYPHGLCVVKTWKIYYLEKLVPKRDKWKERNLNN